MAGASFLRVERMSLQRIAVIQSGVFPHYVDRKAYYTRVRSPIALSNRSVILALVTIFRYM